MLVCKRWYCYSIDVLRLFVCVSVRPSVCPTHVVLYQNKASITIISPMDSPNTLVLQKKIRFVAKFGRNLSELSIFDFKAPYLRNCAVCTMNKLGQVRCVAISAHCQLILVNFFPALLTNWHFCVTAKKFFRRKFHQRSPYIFCSPGSYSTV